VRQVSPAPAPKNPPIRMPETALQSMPAFSPVVHTPVQVNVNQSKMSHSLGIGSLVIGFLAFFVCWTPFVGVFFAGIGFLLGAAGVVIAVQRKGSGVGYSIAGSAVSLVALVIGGVVTAGTSAVVLSLYEAAVGSSAEAIQAERADKVEQNTENPDTPENVIPVEENGVDKSVPPAAKNDPLWKDASFHQVIGNVRISITMVVTGTVPLRAGILDRESESLNELLMVWLKIENISKRTKIDYSGWMSKYASLRDIDASLTDDVDNRYRQINFSGLSTVHGATPSESIYPGTAIEDAIVFELPVKGTRFLRLKLTSNAFGEEGDIRFQIPASMIVRK